MECAQSGILTPLNQLLILMAPGQRSRMEGQKIKKAPGAPQMKKGGWATFFNHDVVPFVYAFAAYE